MTDNVINDSIDLSQTPKITGFFDDASNTVSYVVQDSTSAACAIIDSVLDIDYSAGRLNYQQADDMVEFIEKQQLTLQSVSYTHLTLPTKA